MLNFAYSDPTNPLIIEISNANIDGKRVVIDAIRIERMDDDASIPVFSSPGDAMMILNHNDAVAEDTNLDGAVTALDALLVINDISSGVVTGESSSSISDEIRLTDVNADGQVTALDALTVLNAISRGSWAEGESAIFGPESLSLRSSGLIDGSALDDGQHRARCLEEMDWDTEETLSGFGETSSSAEVDNVVSASLNSSSADAVYGGDRAGRNETALTKDSLDEFFSELDHELAKK